MYYDEEIERQREEYALHEEKRQLEIEHHRQLYIEEQWHIASMKRAIKQKIGLIGDVIYKLMSYKEVFEPWLAQQPEAIQELAKTYPPGTYKVKEGAPYSITAPGCTVLLISWLENGMVGVLVEGKDKSEEALEHEAMLCEQYKKSKEETQNIHDASISAHVDPQHLELVTNELEDAVD